MEVEGKKITGAANGGGRKQNYWWKGKKRIFLTYDSVPMCL